MKKLLVLDLDETLIHATETPEYSHHFNVGPYAVFKRPHLDDFLLFCNDHFEIGIWTSSTEDYAKGIVEKIIPDTINISFLWARERCIKNLNYETNEFEWIKDLKKLRKKGYRLEHIIVIDDSPEKLQRQYGNLVRVSPFFGEEKDDELKLLSEYLKILTEVENIRSIEKRNWKHRIEI